MIRLAICQPLVPHYRVPVFNMLGTHPDIQLSVFAGGDQGSLKAVHSSERFCQEISNVRNIYIGPLQFRYQPAQIEAIDSNRFDMVILPWDAHYLNLPFSLWLGKRKGAPIVLWGHGYSRKGKGFRDKVRNAYGKRADAVLLYSRTVADILIREHGYEPERVFVAQNAIDQMPIALESEHWRQDEVGLTHFREKWGLNPARTIIFVSRLEADNNIEMLIQALGLLRVTYPDAKLVIIGDGSVKQDLETLVFETGQKEAVIFTGAIYDDQALAPWMLCSTLFCYPVNIGLSILHAFGYGLPVVTSDNIGRHNPEIEALIPGENGLFYRDGDVADMASQWKRIIENPGLRERLSTNARKQVTEKYTLENMVNGFLELLSLLEKKINLR
jgi:glycosyltransferase involved in cell wall biosynthesis